MYIQPHTPDEIWHHGINGMHWGIRRYQNEDGSLTPLGEKHVAANRGIQTGGKNGERAASLASSVAKSLRESKTNAQVNAMNLKDMSDETLQAAINRLNMEKQYKALVAENLNAGRKSTEETLDRIGKTLATASSVAAMVGNVASAVSKIDKIAQKAKGTANN